MITRIIDWLTPPQKVGQIIQADIASVTPDDVAAYRRAEWRKLRTEG